MLGKVEICGVNTAKLPVLKEKEKMELIVKAQAGDKEARQKMINGNLRLVLSVVQKFTGRGENLDDLFQVGCIGLIKAIDNFNPGLGLRFSTYGQPMIIGEIRRFLRDNNAIRVSRSMRDMAYRAMQDCEHGKWVGYYANECQTDVRQTVQVCGYLMSFARTLGEGPHYYAWMREFGDPEDERRIMLILNTEPHPGDDDLWLLMEQRWGE